MQNGANSDDLLGGERADVPSADDVKRSETIAKSLHGEDAARDPRTSREPGGRYLMAMIFGGAFVLAAFMGLLHGLRLTGHLPPPALSNSVCIDEKLQFLRNMPAADPNLLIVGSSVAWRGIDGAVIEEAAPGAEPLNGGFCGLQANQSAFVTDWLVSHYPGTRAIVMLAVPQDFVDCTTARTEVFDPTEADAYVFSRAWLWGFYFRYFDPVSLIRNAVKIAAQRGNRIPLDPLVFTKTGDGPLDTSTTRSTLGDGAMTSFDASCFVALHDMAKRAAATGRRFTIVQMPIKPEWSRSYDPQGKVHDLFEGKIDEALSGTGGERWDAGTHTALPESAFTDAIHLRWSAVPQLSRAIALQVLPADGL